MSTSRRSIFAVLAAPLAAVGLLSGLGPQTSAAASSSSPADATSCPWVGQSASPTQRASEVLAQMTLPEKIGMLNLAGSPDGYENVTTAVPRLCVPRLTLQDGPAGVTAGPPGTKTQLPAPIDLAATWDQSVAEAYGQVQGSESLAKGVDAAQGPDVNIVRVPQSGRAFETYGEDPLLSGQLGVSDIDGIQSQQVMAMVKHFAAYNQETYRNTPADDVIINQRTLHEIYFPAFWQAVKQGNVGSLMCSYATINGTYACQDHQLITDVLKDQWSFQGFVRSDLGASHSTVDSFNAGMDQVKPAAAAELQQAVENGQVPQSRTDDATLRVLREMFRFGVFDRPTTGTPSTDASSPQHTAFARSSAAQGTVLLKNAGNLLPLHGTGARSLAVIGADGGKGADTAGGGSSNVSAGSVVTPYQGIVSAAGTSASVSYNDGSDLGSAAAAAKAAAVALVFVNDPEGEGRDLANLSLPGNQNDLITAVAQANPHTIVVLNTGSPVLMPWLSQVAGVAEAWYPGQEDGNAIASVLFGEVNPSGKLPVTFPRSESATPTSTPEQFPGVNGQVHYSEGLDVGYRGYQAKGIAPLFPFGYGLSYTHFKFSNLQVTPSVVQNKVSGPQAGQSQPLVHVSAKVTNTGSRAGAEVAQLYLGDPAAAHEPPRQLKGFQKVYLQPGQSSTVHFTLSGHALSYWQQAANGWVVPDGTFTVSVGDSSAAAGLPLHHSFVVSRSVGARYANITAPSAAAPQAAVTVRATFVNDGDFPLYHAQYTLQAPKGWKVKALPPAAPSTVAPHQRVQRSWQVTVPESAQGSTGRLTAQLSYQPTANGGARETLRASTTISVHPVVDVTVSPVVVSPGKTGTATLNLTSYLPRSVMVHFTANPPAGIDISPSQGDITVPPQGTTKPLTVTVPAGTTPGTYQVPITLTVTDHGRTYQLTPVRLAVTVPAASLSAAFNNIGITDNADHTPGNFDGFGNSYSAQALASVGITPGSTVTHGGISFTWPNVPAGQRDNVELAGQVVMLTASGSTLGFLGAATNGNQTATGTLTYTDGTTQQFSLTLTDWFSQTPAAGDQLVATTPYLNRTNGKPIVPVSLFSTTVPLASGKTVASVTLPSNSNMHVFSVAPSPAG